MPLYLVRWPRLEASLVLADDEEHLVDVLDEVGDPGAASWTEYLGPLWVDFDIGVDAEHKGNGHAWSVTKVEEAAKQEYVGSRLSEGNSETGHEMMTAVISGAFPHVGQLLDASEDGTVDPEQLRAAALRDLESHKPSSVVPAGVRDSDEG